jgi:putative FmdB family regulatory protein
VPTYQYACLNADCGNQFELVQSFTDAAATECPVCAQPVRKVFGSVGVVFKGSGFYRTDSRKADKAAVKADSAKSDSPSSSATPSPSSSSTESSSSSTKSAASTTTGSTSGGSSSAA